MKVIKGVQPTAPKLIIYGNSGVGKSTLASTMPDPIFLDLEGGLSYIDVPRTPVLRDSDEFFKCLLDLAKDKDKTYKTIVIDSADWLVRSMSEKVAGVGYDDDGKKMAGSDGLVALEKTLSKNLMDANGGYGKAKEELENYIRTKLIGRYLSGLSTMGYGIVLIAHAYSTELLGDDGMAVEKVMPKIDPPTIGRKPIAAPALIEWVDNVFYLKNIGGDRILQVEGDDFAVAKNRLGLPQKEYNLKETSLQEILKLKKGDK